MHIKLPFAILIGFLLLMPVSSFGGTTEREYHLENCERRDFWKEVAIDFRYTYPEALEVLNAIPQPDQAVRLTLEEERQIEDYEPLTRAQLEECLLLVKEVNQFVGSAQKHSKEGKYFYALWLEGLFIKRDIPYLYLEDTSRNPVFSFNLSAVGSPDSF